MKHLRKFYENESKVSIFGREWIEFLPGSLTIVTDNGEFELDKYGDYTYNLMNSVSFAYTQNTMDEEGGEPLADGEPDSLQFDVHMVKNNEGDEGNPTTLRLNVDITYGDNMQCEFTIERDEQGRTTVATHHYNGKNSIYDKDTYFGFTKDSLAKLVEFFNRFGFTATPEDFKFLDDDQDDYSYEKPIEKGKDLRPMIGSDRPEIEELKGGDKTKPDMKHIKHYEELDYSTYASAARKLRKLSPQKNRERADALMSHADEIALKNNRAEMAANSPIQITILNKEANNEGTGTFYFDLEPEYDTLEDGISGIEGNPSITIPFTMVIVPADDETVEMCSKTMPEGKDLSHSGYGALWLEIGLELEAGTFKLGRVKIVNMDEYVYGDCQITGRASYGHIRNKLYKMFSDESSRFYQEFEESVMAGQGLSSEYGLSMSAIADHIKRLSINSDFMAD